MSADPVTRLLLVLALGLMLAVIAASAQLRLVRSGPGCSPWPQCYGRLAGTAETGANPARRVHRASAGGLALILLGLLGRVWRRGPHTMLPPLLAAAALTAGLAALGIWSGGVAPVAVTLGNLLGGMALLALLWLAWLQQGPRASGGARDRHLQRLARGGLAGATLVLVLGAVSSATFGLQPCAATGGCSLRVLLDWQRVPVAAVHAWATVVLLPAVAAALGAWRRPGLRRTAATVLGITALAVLSGLVVTATPAGLGPALVHNLAAALLVPACLTLLWRKSAPRTG